MTDKEASGWKLIPVQTHTEGYASIPECVKAGLPRWDLNQQEISDTEGRIQ